MKIFYPATVRLPTEKAHGVQIMHMCAAFANEGARVELCIPELLIDADPFSFYGVSKSFSITRVGGGYAFLRRGRLGFPLHTLLVSLRMAYEALTRRDAVIYSRDYLTLFFLSFTHTRFFFECHTKRLNFAAARVVRKAEGVIAISGGLAELLRPLGPKRLLVAHDGADTEFFASLPMREALKKELGLPPEKTIAYIGKFRTMGEEKGVREIIEAWSTASQRARLLLVGIEPADERELRASVRQDLLQKLTIIGHLPWKEAMRYLKAADLLLMNYPATEHYARFMSPLKLFEYMASGNPIVSTDLPSIREVIGPDEAFLTAPGSVESLSRGIDQALSDEGEAARRAAGALEKAKRYSWSARAQSVIAFMENTSL